MLFKKLLRTLLRYKAQFISMIIMIILGVGIFIGFNMEWVSLEKDTDYILTETKFADYRILSETGFSEEDLDKIKQIEGVSAATRYLSINTTVNTKAAGATSLENDGTSAETSTNNTSDENILDGDIIALTVNENMAVSTFYLMEGETYDPDSLDGIWLSDQYAAQNNLQIGDTLTLTYKLITVTAKVKGLIKAGEYMICVPDETQLMPDYTTYGFAYIAPALFRDITGMEFYTQINVLSTLDKPEFVEQAEDALNKTMVILSKDETISYAEAMGEVEEGKTMGSILPVLFLAIAILTMVTTMHRITASEKTQIGTLKALGFKDKRILAHYTSYALFIGLVGSAFGIALGYFIGWFIMNPGGAMGTYIDMPEWKLYMPWFCWVVLAVMIIGLTFIGFLSVKQMLKGTAADALRPYTPKRMRHLKIEETRAFKRLNFGTKWNLRDLLRHKSRSFMTLFGMVGCVVIFIGGMGMKDTMDGFIQSFYQDAIAYENRVNLDTESTTRQEAEALAEDLQGDWNATISVQVGDKPYSLEIYHITYNRVRFLDLNMDFLPLTEEGVYVCSRLAEEFGLRVGDSLTFKPYGEDESFKVPIRGIARSLTESIVMSDTYADEIGIPYQISSIFTKQTEVAASGHIVNVQSKKAIMDSFDVFMELMNLMIFLLILVGVILGVVVLYNLGVMSYTERYREMATLKVVGFKDKKIGSLLISQNLWLTIVGILLGIPLGVALLDYLIKALASEYELLLVVRLSTYLISAALTFGVSLLVGLMVARKNRHIDMVAALKTEE